jgi:hypothetical protein
MPLRCPLGATMAVEERCPGSAANGDGGYEVIEPNSRVLLPIELDYPVAKLDSFRQWHGAN